MRFLDNRGIKQKDVLMLLVSGEDVFLQPYSGEYMTATLDSDDATETGVSINLDSGAKASK